jgi:hypothetical protein
MSYGYFSFDFEAHLSKLKKSPDRMRLCLSEAAARQCSIFRGRALPLVFACRSIVGGSISESSVSTSAAVSAPLFGTSRRRARRETEKKAQEAAQIEALRAAREAPLPEVEAAARETVKEHYGFLMIPLYMEYWQHFLVELRRFEFHWQIGSPCGNVYRFMLIERTVGGENQLCVLRSDKRRANCLVEFFDAIGYFIVEGPQKRDIKFDDGSGNLQILRVTCAPSLGDYNPSRAEQDRVGWSVEERDARGDVAQSVRIGHFVDMELIDSATGSIKVLVKGLSLQTLAYLLMASIPPFLNRHDLGVRNMDFLPKEQIKMIRFTWCFFRREMRMTPVDIGELNEMLPE